MAVLHVASWGETYRGLMSDAVLDDPSAVARRRHFWTTVLTDTAFGRNRVAVAEQGDRLVGIVMAGPASEPDAIWAAQLYVLYTSASVHGSGIGTALLDEVVRHDETTGLWVADPNPAPRRSTASTVSSWTVPSGRTMESANSAWSGLRVRYHRRTGGAGRPDTVPPVRQPVASPARVRDAHRRSRVSVTPGPARTPSRYDSGWTRCDPLRGRPGTGGTDDHG